MARRSDFTRDELRQMAIESGQKIIALEGFKEFSARKVAREIGYSIGTIYNIFVSHDDFILHINAVTLDDMAKFLTQRINGTGNVAIKQLAEGYLDFATDNFNRWNALFEHRISEAEPLPDWYTAKITELFEIVIPHFIAITNNKHEAQIAAKTIWASIHGICQLSLNGKLDTVGVELITELTDSLIDNYLSGLSLKSAKPLT